MPDTQRDVLKNVVGMGTAVVRPSWGGHSNGQAKLGGHRRPICSLSLAVIVERLLEDQGPTHSDPDLRKEHLRRGLVALS